MFLLLLKLGISTLASTIKLLVLLMFFIALLFGAHFFTKWYGKNSLNASRFSNIQIVEMRQIVPGKSIVIARIGKKLISFVLTKDNASMLTELQEEDLTAEEMPGSAAVPFREVLQRLKKGDGKK